MKMEETLIVNISILGSADSGMGSRTFSINVDPSGEGAEAAAMDMTMASTGALADAIHDLAPKLMDYFAKKYGSGGGMQ